MAICAPGMAAHAAAAVARSEALASGKAYQRPFAWRNAGDGGPQAAKKSESGWWKQGFDLDARSASANSKMEMVENSGMETKTKAEWVGHKIYALG